MRGVGPWTAGYIRMLLTGDVAVQAGYAAHGRRAGRRGRLAAVAYVRHAPS
ncbi:hypothetical protein [Streptomyces sp. BRA346]|uniref:hypothetical protein n=1 Tax=Streptomyces sp. BRA346 TaxID=2878199 RepID=UPI004062C62A